MLFRSLIQRLRQNEIAWPEVRRLFNETYPEEKRSEDALRKVHSRTLSLPTSSPKSAQPPKIIQFAAIHTPADPPSLRRSHESTATQQPCKPLAKKKTKIDKNLEERKEILRLHKDKTKPRRTEQAHYINATDAPETIEVEK